MSDVGAKAGHRSLFTSESVTEGHPDKVCDQISDAVVDACLSETPLARVACETGIKSDGDRQWVAVFGETTPKIGRESVEELVRGVLTDIGYTDREYGIDASEVEIDVLLSTQSNDIAQGVDQALEARQGTQTDDFNTGAGDQGMMFGYACDETEELMPLPIVLAHKLTRRLAELRKNGRLAWLRPDGKSQVSVEYDGGDPVRVDTIVVSTQHEPEAGEDKISQEVLEELVSPVVGFSLVDSKTRYFVNPTGRFVVGGPLGDAGVTGRKIIVDTYGGAARHGGGAFSGKDPTKVDRSAAYAARWVAKNLVAATAARRCELRLAYAIGVARPVSVSIDTFGTGIVPDSKLESVVSEIFDLRPAAIISNLNLRRPIYRQTASYGHFGRTDLDLPWEQTNKAVDVRSALGL